MMRFLKWTAIIALFWLPTFTLAQEYTIDPNHSYVTWTVDHFGYSKITGKAFAEGKIIFDAKNPNDSKMDININMANMTTGIKALDEHLQSKDFFELNQYPTATFKSVKVLMTGKNTATVTGTLTIHGVSKPLVLQAKLNKQGEHPLSHKQAIGFSAKGTLNRSDFGLKAYAPAVSDKVDLDITGEAAVDSAKSLNS